LYEKIYSHTSLTWTYFKCIWLWRFSRGVRVKGLRSALLWFPLIIAAIRRPEPFVLYQDMWRGEEPEPGFMRILIPAPRHHAGHINWSFMRPSTAGVVSIKTVWHIRWPIWLSCPRATSCLGTPLAKIIGHIVLSKFLKNSIWWSLIKEVRRQNKMHGYWMNVLIMYYILRLRKIIFCNYTIFIRKYLHNI